MSNVIVEGFGSYGIGDGTIGNPIEAVAEAMLSGIWAQRANAGSGVWGIGQLPWDTANGDLYLYATISAFSSGTAAWRRVLPEPLSDSRWSFYYACSQLPSASGGPAIQWLDGFNNEIASLQLQTTGALALITNGVIRAITTGPVMVAQTAVHMEMKLDTAAATFQLYVQGELVINASAVPFFNPGPCAQFNFIYPGSNVSVGIHYGGHLIVRDSEGDFNNSFPIGERKVATLFVNSDDVAHQGWSNHPLHRFGVGILNCAVKDTALNPLLCAVTTNDATHTDLLDGDYTIEGQFRFQSLPKDADKMVLWGKWDELNNKRSYQFYLGGPNLDHGLLTFRTSTDGQNGTVVNKLQWDWKPDPGTWYEIALVRASGELLLFIDGVQQGLPEPDTDIYYQGTELFVLYAQAEGTGILPSTNLIGWQDEFRITKGVARYLTNYAPHTAAFPRNAGDPNWGAVVWLSSWDNGVVADDGPLGLPLVAQNGAVALTPDDGAFNYQSINQNKYPFDDNFIEAALIAATSLLTANSNPAAGNTVTAGNKAVATPAVYTFRVALAAPFDVLIGASIFESMSNLVAAINNQAGEGVTYGTGTTANLDIGALLQPSNQVQAFALVPGTDGNSIAIDSSGGTMTWTDSNPTLEGGLDIPPYSQFGLQRMPSNTAVVDSISIGSRQWKTDVGAANTQISFVGPGGGILAGQDQANSTTPTVVFDTFENDPDNPASPLSPTAILLSKVRVNRLV